MNAPILVNDARADYIESEVAAAVSIYSTLFPTQSLNFLFYEGKDPVWGHPSVSEASVTLAGGHLSAEFLGRVRRPGICPGAPEVSIFLSIPRKPLPNEVKQLDAPWLPPGKLRPLFRLSPMLYETIRYQVEMRRKEQAQTRHSHVSLSKAEGAAVFSGATPPETDKRPAILIGLHWLEVGGAERLGLDTIEWALEAGLRVFVVAGVPAIHRLADTLPDSADVTFIRLDRYLPPHLWPRYVEQLILTENIRMVHIHHCGQLYDSLPHLRATTPWVQVIDSTHIVEYNNGGFPRISGVWSNYIDIHHVISRELVDYYRDRFLALHKVRLGRMLKGAQDAAQLPAMTMASGKKTLQITFVGRLSYQKRPVLVALMFKALAEWARRNDVTLKGKIIGEGPFLQELTALVKRYHLADTVELLPANAPVPEIMQESDILLLPSNNEGLALVCYEAIEKGCIPISTDVGSQNEIIPEELLLPLAPRAAVSRAVDIVDKLWRDPAFLERQRDALARLWTGIKTDPTAKQILMPFYEAAANTK